MLALGAGLEAAAPLEAMADLAALVEGWVVAWAVRLAATLVQQVRQAKAHGGLMLECCDASDAYSWRWVGLGDGVLCGAWKLQQKRLGDWWWRT
jgi:hypothetical protein